MGDSHRRFMAAIFAVGISLTIGMVGIQPAAAMTATSPQESSADLAVPTETEQKWPLYKVAYDTMIYELITNVDATQTPVPLTFVKWRDVYAYEEPQLAPTEYLKYAWSPSIYAVTKWPGGEANWMWVPLSFLQWQTAGFPTPGITAWIKGSRFYKWVTDIGLFVKGADGIKHQLTYVEWEASGFQSFDEFSDAGFVKLSWSSDIAYMSSLSRGNGRPIVFAEWRDQAFPVPAVYQRLTGDAFYKEANDATLWYDGPTMHRRINFLEWQAAGFPVPEIRAIPANPGPAVSCTYFSKWYMAQQWFDTYYPYYGDIAGLDPDGDLISCENLYGAPVGSWAF
jgi:hypothetical protein